MWLVLDMQKIGDSYSHCLLGFLFLAMLHDMRNLKFLDRGAKPMPPAVEVQSFNHRTAGEVPKYQKLLKAGFKCSLLSLWYSERRESGF